MALGCLAAVCCCIWEPVKQALLAFLGTGVTDSLSSLRDRAVEGLRGRIALWGHRIQRLPSSTASIRGRGELLSKVLGLLRGDEKGIIGLYGMGGVGKTTLLLEINNHLLESRDNPFDVVIWVTVSKDMDIRKIQEDIGTRLGFSRPGAGQGRPLPTDEHDRRRDLHQALFGKKFLLLLDDMWEALDLQNVGVPHPSCGKLNRGKIVFTTRSRDVCAGMDADAKLRVDCLNPEESWELFCSKVGDEVDLNNHPLIRPLAEYVVEKCGGVPLALITVGRAMSGETSIRGWENLSESLNDIGGMEKDVFSILKLSFDRLGPGSAKECLLYCSLFPEDAGIDVDELIGLWIGEGFLDSDSDSANHTTLHQARMKGHTIIKTLKNACLLEDAGYTSVRLHDLVREMALWLTKKTYKTIVHGSDKKRLGGSAEVEGWQDARRISIDVQSGEDDLPCPQRECPKLITFLVHCAGFDWCWVPDLKNFIDYMQALRVLDLSHTNLIEVPSAIGLLVELRHLNLECTKIKSLPQEMGQLVKLQQLNLCQTGELSHVPREALVTLQNLQSLDLFASGVYMSWQGDDGDEEGVDIFLRDLESNIGRLEELGVNIHASECLWNLANSKKFQRCTRKLEIGDVPGLTAGDLSIVSEKLENLEHLSIFECESLQGEWRVDGALRRLKWLTLAGLAGLRGFVGDLRCLRELVISDCKELKDLSCVGRLPCLEVLFVHICGNMVEVVQQPVGDGQGHRDRDGEYTNSLSFPVLREIRLVRLSSLTSISEGTLLFPSLETLVAVECPRLKRLPLGLGSGKKIRTITGEQGWWDGLEWDNSSVQSAFAPYFFPWR